MLSDLLFFGKLDKTVIVRSRHCDVNIIVPWDKTFKPFAGYKNGDAYIFRYNTTIDTISDNSLLPYAEYQFYDADFDREEELIIGSYAGGPHGSPCYDIYDMTDSRLVQKRADDGFSSFWLDSDSEFDSENKQIRNTIYCGAYAWGEYVYKVNKEGQYHLLSHIYFESDFDHNIPDLDGFRNKIVHTFS